MQGMTPSDVKRLRRRLDMTQARFAELIGVAPNTVARWESGNRAVPPTTARLIRFVVDESDRKRAGTRKRS
jgi:DNA-binding transcriptional regulator YiaG